MDHLLIEFCRRQSVESRNARADPGRAWLYRMPAMNAVNWRYGWHFWTIL
jgi:hypothetical protein